MGVVYRSEVGKYKVSLVGVVYRNEVGEDKVSPVGVVYRNEVGEDKVSHVGVVYRSKTSEDMVSPVGVVYTFILTYKFCVCYWGLSSTISTLYRATMSPAWNDVIAIQCSPHCEACDDDAMSVCLSAIYTDDRCGWGLIHLVQSSLSDCFF